MLPSRNGASLAPFPRNNSSLHRAPLRRSTTHIIRHPPRIRLPQPLHGYNRLVGRRQGAVQRGAPLDLRGARRRYSSGTKGALGGAYLQRITPPQPAGTHLLRLAARLSQVPFQRQLLRRLVRRQALQLRDGWAGSRCSNGVGREGQLDCLKSGNMGSGTAVSVLNVSVNVGNPQNKQRQELNRRLRLLQARL